MTKTFFPSKVESQKLTEKKHANRKFCALFSKVGTMNRDHFTVESFSEI